MPTQIEQIGKAHPNKRILTCFLDEARFGQQGTLTRKWAPTGSRPPAVKQTQYDWLYVIGAVCPETGQTFGMLSPYINTEIINTFLQQFSEQLASDVHVVLIWDQAGFHCANHLRIPSNITILPLPPYSPELNPVENLWHHLRSNYWANREYSDYEALSDAACEAWQNVCLNPEIIKSVCHVPYIEPRRIDL